MSRKILSPMNMGQWLKSQAYADYTGMLAALSASVERKTCASSDPSANVQALLSLLDLLTDKVDVFPPIDQPQRFGNKAFRSWHAWLVEDSKNVINEHLKGGFETESVTELALYLNDSFGNPTRVDYGTGHEACFCMFLCGLFKLKFLNEQDSDNVVLRVFRRYIALCRKLQTTYNMEPAGSHGVWSLDDFQFLPFLFGSAQMIDHPTVSPSSIAEENVVTELADENLFMEATKHIYQVKTGPFFEHSNQLWNISSVKHWSKVHTGLMKMYKAEVLGKFPVVQHFLFGSLLSFDPVTPPSAKDPTAM